MAYVEVQPEFTVNFEEVKRLIEETCVSELPDYEHPKYIVQIDKIPYKNTKHNFKELESMGREYVNSMIIKNIKENR